MSEIKVPPPDHVKFTKQGRAYVEMDHLIDSQLKTAPPPPSQDDLEVARETAAECLAMYSLTQPYAEVLDNISRRILASLSSARVAGEQAERERAVMAINEVVKDAALGGPVALACLKIAGRLKAIDGGDDGN